MKEVKEVSDKTRLRLMAEIDAAYYGIKLIMKTETDNPKLMWDEAVFGIRHIIKCKKAICSDYSGDEKTLKELIAKRKLLKSK